jgi:hypothetical protein
MYYVQVENHFSLFRLRPSFRTKDFVPSFHFPPYNVSSDGELRGVVGKLTNGRAAGASGMRAKHVKKWLHDVRQEEDPEGQGAEDAGDRWRLFVWLVQAA